MPLKHIHTFCILLFVAAIGSSCSPRSSSASSRQELVKKYSPAELRKDFDVMREILENFHPSLYWYTPKDSMDLLFSQYRAAIRDSMTQQQFGFSVLAPVTTAIRCGHTSFAYSKKYNEGMKGVRLPSFPLFAKVYGDSMIVLGNLNRKDSLIKRGTAITHIDGHSVQELSQTMFRFMPTDGYANNINYIRLSNNFPFYHRNIYGLKKTYTVGYIDSAGHPALSQIPVYDPGADTAFRRRDSATHRPPMPPRPGRKERLADIRSLKFMAPGDRLPSTSDSLGGTAVMTLNSFDGDGHLNRFFRQSFREIKNKNASSLVIDIRSNGGGKVNNYTRLASYLRTSPFKVADTAYAVRRGFSGYGKYFSMRTLNALALGFFTTKHADGNYHFRYWERHQVKPKKKNFFRGTTYIIISGPTFSASTLFAQTMKGQPHVLLVGEEAGGGAYGNNGLMIPYITLPHTRMRVRMPLFRVVQFAHGEKDGRGVTPDLYVAPSGHAAVMGIDTKMQRIKTLIQTSFLNQQ